MNVYREERRWLSYPLGQTDGRNRSARGSLSFRDEMTMSRCRLSTVCSRTRYYHRTAPIEGAYEKDHMTLIDLRNVKDEQTAQEGAGEDRENYLAESDEEISPDPVPISQKRRLDVDAVLRRSLPRLTAEEL